MVNLTGIAIRNSLSSCHKKKTGKNKPAQVVVYAQLIFFFRGISAIGSSCAYKRCSDTEIDN
jgi:hypothetical protein